MGGVRTAAEIINLMKTQQEEPLLPPCVNSTASWHRKSSTDVPVRESGGCRRSQHSATVAEVDSESLLIALKGAEQPLRGNSCAICRSVPPIFCATISPPWSGASVAGGKRTESDSADWRRLAETGEMVIGSGEDTYVYNLPWKTWTPDDLAPPQAEFCPWSSRKKPSLKRPNPALSRTGATANAGPRARLSSGDCRSRQQGHEQGYQEGLAQGLEQVWQRRSLNKRQFMPGCSNWSRISNYP